MKILCAVFELPVKGTANPAHLPQNWAKLAILSSWQLQNGPQNFDFFFLSFLLFFFSIAIGTDHSFYVKSIATYAPTFFGYNNSVVVIVSSDLQLTLQIAENPIDVMEL